MAQKNEPSVWATRNGRRVAPAPNSSDDMVEVRRKRVLRIRHINPKRRDDKFEKEMQAFMQYRHSRGLVLGGAAFIDKKLQSKSLGESVNTETKTANGTTGFTKPSNSNGTRDIGDRGVGNHDQTDDARTNSTTTNGINTDLSTDISGNHTPLQKHLSPSRFSMASEGVQSASGIHVGVSRPVSETNPMSVIGEQITEVESDSRTECMSREGTKTVKSAKSPRKTKGHRPISAKSIKQQKKSVSEEQDTTQLIDLDVLMSSHSSSPYKDATFFLIHGVGGSAEVWNAQLDFFAGFGAELVAVDLIGHGYSSCPDDLRSYHFSEILEDLQAVFDRYCKRQNIVIAHSYGCAFAAVLGRTRSRRVTKLVLMSGGAPIPLAPQPGLFSLPVCLLSCFKPCLFNRFERDAFYEVSTQNSKVVAFDISPTVLSHVMNGQDWMDGDELYHSWLSMPALLLYGKHDKFVSLEDEQEMKETIYNSRLEVLNKASHMVMIDAADEVNRLLYEFIYTDQPAPHHLRSLNATPSARKHRSKNIQ